jgi:hypothetical protein
LHTSDGAELYRSKVSFCSSRRGRYADMFFRKKLWRRKDQPKFEFPWKEI